MTYIGQYELLSEEQLTSSSVYWKAKKDGTCYFLKRFNDPKRPSERASESVKKLKNKQCDTFFRERKRILNAVKNFTGGNLVAPVEIFEHEKRYYQSTQWREIKDKSIVEIAALSEKEKLLILKTAAQSLKILNERKIIHLDVKPDNLPVAETMTRRLSCSLIDFDSSYFEDAMPEPDFVSVTDPYMSPELAAYKMGRTEYKKKVTVKNDVFALAIVFHKYWSGRNFIYEGSDSTDKDPYLYNIVFAGKKVATAPDIPKWLDELLLWMIKKEPEDRPTMAQVLDLLKKNSVSTRAESADEHKDKADKTEIEDIKPKLNEKDYFTEIRNRRNEAFGDVEEQYRKGSKFPEDAASFEVLPNGNIRIIYNDGTRITLKSSVALMKKYIIKD